MLRAGAGPLPHQLGMLQALPLAGLEGVGSCRRMGVADMAAFHWLHVGFFSASFPA